ncbi:MAG: exopolyphosphatase [Bacteroidota bacterium]
MRIAVIDLGTNTFHLVIAEVEKDSHTILYRDRKPVKIGEKGINKGEITPQAWERALHTILEFKEIIVKHDISEIFATATSAIRSANNGEALAKEIYRLTGIEIEIISGLREAELIHLGAKEALDFGTEKSLIMDIGGGSIEFIIADSRKAYWMQSFEVGCQRLIERFHKNDPITSEEMDDLHEFFKNELTPLFEVCKEHQPTTLIGCSGAFDTLSDIHCVLEEKTIDENETELPLDIPAFNGIYPELIKKNRKERLSIPGMIEMRVDMIVVACVLIDFIICKLSLSDIRVSAYALKEGILFNVLRKFQAR